MGLLTDSTNDQERDDSLVVVNIISKHVVGVYEQVRMIVGSVVDPVSSEKWTLDLQMIERMNDENAHARSTARTMFLTVLRLIERQGISNLLDKGRGDECNGSADSHSHLESSR